MVEEPTGFLGRWARRKNDALQGKPLDEPAPVQKIVPVAAAAAAPLPLATDPAAAQPPATEPAPAPEKLLSLDDVKALTGDSDFKPFMARSVGPEVRNAAMKKLFADPHYNVMDGLDIYIGDYSIADPIPESMLRQMVGAQLLKIFDAPDDEGEESKALAAQAPPAPPLPGSPDEPAPEPAPAPNNVATPTPSGQAAQTPAQSALATEPASQPVPLAGAGASPQDDHAHSHLRLQPDHAPPAENAGRGAS